jgi:sulfate/thiosulfate transport system permease protein
MRINRLTRVGQSWLQSNRQYLITASLISLALLYIVLVLYIPTANVFVRAFQKGVGPLLSNLNSPDFLHAVKLTVLLALISVPLNTIFGLCAALAIARKNFPGRTLLLSIIDLPFSISPIVVGLMLVLLYGRLGWFGPWLEANDIKIIFAFPSMVLGTIIVSMPFVAREVLPVLEETGEEEEEAAKILGASSWQTFWYITLPNIRWGLLYGVILTNARAMGEFGAVAVVSGNITGKTQSLPLFVEESYVQYATEEAYSAAVILALLAVITLVLKSFMERKVNIRDRAL